MPPKGKGRKTRAVPKKDGKDAGSTKQKIEESGDDVTTDLSPEDQKTAKKVKGEEGQALPKKEGEQDEEQKKAETKQEGETEARRAEEDGQGKPDDEQKQRIAGDSKADGGTGELEHGWIYFFYRPKVNDDDPTSIDEIARFHIVMFPRSKPHGEKKNFHRIMNIGKKRLPDAEKKHGHETFWASIEGVGDDLDVLRDELKQKEYETKTRGKRHKPAARPAGRGVYAICKKDGKTYLAYALSTPREQGDVQEELAIYDEGSYVIQVKDPTQPGPLQASLPPEKRAEYPKELQELFGSRKFIAADPVELLDYGGAELLIIAGRKDVKQSVGEEIGKELEEEAADEMEAPDEILKDLRMKETEFPAEPLEGKWA